MRRLVGAALVAAGVAACVATAAPAATAVPECAGVVDTNCVNGARYCRIWISPTRTCTFVA